MSEMRCDGKENKTHGPSDVRQDALSPVLQSSLDQTAGDGWKNKSPSEQRTGCTACLTYAQLPLTYLRVKVSIKYEFI